MKPAAAIPPVASGPNVQIVDTPRKQTSTVGSRYRKRKQSVPVWAWIAGGFGVLVLFCCGGPMMMLPHGQQMRREREQAHERRMQEIQEATRRTVAETERFNKEWEAGREEREARAKRFAEIEAESRRAEQEAMITRSEYQSVGFGNSPETVSLILGVEGTESASSSGFKILTYRGNNGVTVSVTYRYDSEKREWRYSSKAQFGL